MKKTLFFIATIIIVVSCKKDTKATTSTPPSSTSDNYSSVQVFFANNNVAMQTYTVNANTGGSFSSPQGTTVTVPANAFTTQSGTPVTGNVTIQFKDIYKKSDMFLANMPTNIGFGGAPLKSGGEFFIKTVQNNSALILASGKKITVSQPASLTGGIDNAMKAFILKDSMMNNCPALCPSAMAWTPPVADTVSIFSQNYIFSLYEYNNPVDSGSWCNSDNATYFAAYPQTTLILLAKDSVATYGTEVFLFFKNQSSMVHVYGSYYEYFPYQYAPQGLQCTVVAIGIKGGKLYSSFVPIIIGANQTVPFTLSPTTTSAFTTQLKTLD